MLSANVFGYNHFSAGWSTIAGHNPIQPSRTSIIYQGDTENSAFWPDSLGYPKRKYASTFPIPSRRPEKHQRSLAASAGSG
jgi:hypothetical protein